MTIPFDDLEKLRAMGVSRVLISNPDGTLDISFFSEQTLSDVPDELDPTQCAEPGCTKPNGWSRHPSYCEEHGRLHIMLERAAR